MGNIFASNEDDELAKVQPWQEECAGVRATMELNGHTVHCGKRRAADEQVAQAFDKLSSAEGVAITPRPQQILEQGMMASGTADKVLYVRKVTRPEDGGGADKLYFATHRIAVSKIHSVRRRRAPDPFVVPRVCRVALNLL
eukprot:SAG31_NODE_3782_length_3884_cov_1.601057_5_plen_141_part_00